jgi:endonuclease G, mitochondrial
LKRNSKTGIALLLLALILLLLILLLRSRNQTTKAPVVTAGRLEIPALNSSDQIVEHTAYTLQYNEPNEQPDWVAYYLTKDRLHGSAMRGNEFREDPLISTGSAQLDDYKHTGYDRGHMAPAADFSWSQTAMSESFYLSNMSPQLHSFNAGIWEALENQVRTWADAENDTLFIVAGPILTNELPTIGTRNKLTVPEYYFKALLLKSTTGLSAIAFILKQENSTKPLSDFAVTIDSLEKVTNIDFFSKLPVATQAEIESKYDLNHWPGITTGRGLRQRLPKH